jgi:hypothetical protein
LEKLTHSNKEVYLEAARVFKKMEEKKECTFKPKVNIEGRRYEDVQDLFERLHEDRARRNESIKYREEQKMRMEVQNCTFSPKTVIPKDPQMRKSRNNGSGPGDKSQIYEKLYSDFDSIQRKKLRQQYERETKVKEELTFKPFLITQTY